MTVAIQLLGGLGTRLSSITQGKIPKPLVQINNKTLVELQIIECIRYGIKDFIWVTFHLNEQFIAEKSRLLALYGHSIDSINIFHEKFPLSTFGSISTASLLVQSNTYLVLYGDLTFSLDLNRLISDFNPDRSDIHVVSRYSDHPHDSDKVVVEDNCVISKYISKKDPPSPQHPATTTSGIYVCTQDFFRKLAHWSGQKCDLFSEVLVSDGYLVNSTAYITAEFIKDVGTVERYHQVKSIYDSGKLLEYSTFSPQKCLLLDRDGVIIKNNGHLTSPDTIVYNDLLLALLSCLREHNILIGFITNQPHIAQGRINSYQHREIKYSIERHLATNQSIDFYLQSLNYPVGGFDDEVPFYKRACSLRKPRTGLFQYAFHKYNIDPSHCLYIGDSDVDEIAASNVGIPFISYSFPDSSFDHLRKHVLQFFNISS